LGFWGADFAPSICSLTAEPRLKTRMHCLQAADHYDLCCRTHADTAHTSMNRSTAIWSQSGKSMAPPDDGHASLISANCGFNPADWCAAQGRELPANAKATSNDTAVASAMPSAPARGRGKPSDLMAFSPQPGAGNW